MAMRTITFATAGGWSAQRLWHMMSHAWFNFFGLVTTADLATEEGFYSNYRFPSGSVFFELDGHDHTAGMSSYLDGRSFEQASFDLNSTQVLWANFRSGFMGQNFKRLVFVSGSIACSCTNATTGGNASLGTAFWGTTVTIDFNVTTTSHLDLRTYQYDDGTNWNVTPKVVAIIPTLTGASPLYLLHSIAVNGNDASGYSFHVCSASSSAYTVSFLAVLGYTTP